MQNQQQNDVRENWKRNFNIAYGIALIHQRAIVMLSRNMWGSQALGVPCALALLLMLFWGALTQDPLMWVWIVLWLFSFIKNRIQSARLKGEIHSFYDGRAIKCGSNERRAKLIIEPFKFAVVGLVALKVYEYLGWPPHGLPYFLLTSVFTLPFCEAVKQSIWNRRVQAMQDARIEQEALVDDYQNKFGN
jgi:hypothetical protein